VGQTLDGKAVAAAVRREVQDRVARLKGAGLEPGLATVLVGDDPASRVYVGNKERACGEVGIRSHGHRLAATTTQSELLGLVRDSAGAPTCTAFSCSCRCRPISMRRPSSSRCRREGRRRPPPREPGPPHGRTAGGRVPCTPLGVMRLIDETGIVLTGRHAAVVGRSVLVGKPVALMLLERHATVTICHSRTRDLAEEVGRADVVVAATGQTGLVRGAWIRPGAVVIDVGINRAPTGSSAATSSSRPRPRGPRSSRPCPAGSAR
jgi:methylenetetrahydrofolate dehydrogenase (NADP+)/methenyltetrahydrofolate cyclohydrolase